MAGLQCLPSRHKRSSAGTGRGHPAWPAGSCPASSGAPRKGAFVQLQRISRSDRRSCWQQPARFKEATKRAEALWDRSQAYRRLRRAGLGDADHAPAAPNRPGKAPVGPNGDRLADPAAVDPTDHSGCGKNLLRFLRRGSPVLGLAASPGPAQTGVRKHHRDFDRHLAAVDADDVTLQRDDAVLTQSVGSCGGQFSNMADSAGGPRLLPAPPVPNGWNQTVPEDFCLCLVRHKEQKHMVFLTFGLNPAGGGQPAGVLGRRAAGQLTGICGSALRAPSSAPCFRG